MSDVGLIYTNAQRIRPYLLSDVRLRKHCCEHPGFYRDCVRAHNPIFIADKNQTRFIIGVIAQ